MSLNTSEIEKTPEGSHEKGRGKNKGLVPVEDFVPFEPTERDVVSTKNRGFNAKHPGNVAYTKLINKHIANIPLDQADLGIFRKVSLEIVNQIIDEQGGRFLKLQDGDADQTVCTVMGRKQALGKVLHAIRTAYVRQGKIERGDSFVMPKFKSKKNLTPTVRKEKKTLSPKSKLNNRTLSREHYAIQMGSMNISPWTKVLIETVCNEPHPETARNILRKPLKGETTEMERSQRLQILQRFAAAAAVGMSPLEFANKLLKLWDAKLVIRKPKPKISTPADNAPGAIPSDTPQPQPSSVGLSNVAIPAGASSIGDQTSTSLSIAEIPTTVPTPKEQIVPKSTDPSREQLQGLEKPNEASRVMNVNESDNCQTVEKPETNSSTGVTSDQKTSQDYSI